MYQFVYLLFSPHLLYHCHHHHHHPRVPWSNIWWMTRKYFECSRIIRFIPFHSSTFEDDDDTRTEKLLSLVLYFLLFRFYYSFNLVVSIRCSCIAASKPLKSLQIVMHKQMKVEIIFFCRDDSWRQQQPVTEVTTKIISTMKILFFLLFISLCKRVLITFVLGRYVFKKLLFQK